MDGPLQDGVHQTKDSRIHMEQRHSDGDDAHQQRQLARI